jgi:hypothetical protein
MGDRLIRVVKNYEAKLRMGVNGPLTEREVQARVTRYGIAAAMEDSVLDQVRQVLCSHGVPTITFPFYHAFSRELGRLTRQELSVESQEREMMVMATKWVMRGLSRPALLDVALIVFNLTPPHSPEGMS